MVTSPDEIRTSPAGRDSIYEPLAIPDDYELLPNHDDRSLEIGDRFSRERVTGADYTSFPANRKTL